MQLRNIMPRTHNDLWEERADKVLSHFNYTEPDEIDLYEICQKYGMKIKPLDKHFYDGEISPGIKALSIPKDKGRRGTIYLLPDLDHVEKKIILAEEFCHLYSHYANQLTLKEYEVNRMENQAKRMAAYLTMPQCFLDKVFVFANDQSVSITDIADCFLVTEEFVQYRLELLLNRKVNGIGSIKGKLGSIEWLE
jgi:Zn-dependent peptidase ImmA (M78 family)